MQHSPPGVVRVLWPSRAVVGPIGPLEPLFYDLDPPETIATFDSPLALVLPAVSLRKEITRVYKSPICSLNEIFC